MKQSDLISRVRSLTRDLSNSIFREVDIIDFLNEGIDRIKQVIPHFEAMEYPANKDAELTYLPKQYQHLLGVYATARCFGQDERHYQASTFMNEFETKLDELKSKIEAGDIVVKDEAGVPVVAVYATDYVDDIYFNKRYGSVDLDDGVEGVE